MSGRPQLDALLYRPWSFKPVTDITGWHFFHVILFLSFTLHKFEVWGAWKVPQMWYSPFKPNLYVDYGNMIHFAVSAWRCHWTQTAHSAQFGGEFCPHSTSPLRSKHFQQNESYFHILHINWDWMDYVTSVELFIDLKPRICEVCTFYSKLLENFAIN